MKERGGSGVEQEEALRQLDESIFFLLLLIAGLFLSLTALFLERQALTQGTQAPADQAARVRRRAAALELVTAGYFLTVTVQSADASPRSVLAETLVMGAAFLHWREETQDGSVSRSSETTATASSTAAATTQQGQTEASSPQGMTVRPKNAAK